MQIAKNTVAMIDYKLRGPDGNVLDESREGEPLAYVHGVGGIIPGLEDALEGKSPGEKLSVTVAPEQGYGERDDELVQAVPRDRFGDAQDIEPGMQFQAQTEVGPRVVTVVGIEEDDVIVDANHPLAGVPLHFDVRVVDVRDATPEELEHRHVHGPGGHHH